MKIQKGIFMKNKKIDFRITEQQYGEILKESERAGIPANAWAREVILRALDPKSEEPSETGAYKRNNITPLSRMQISRELIMMEHYVEKLPRKSNIRNEMEKGLEKIWLSLS